MRIAYLDCFAGVSGDMFLGALVSAGLNWEEWVQQMQKLKLPIEFQQRTVSRKGLSGIKVDVIAKETESPHRHLKEIAGIIKSSGLSNSVREKSLKTFEALAEAEAKVHGTTIENVHFHEVGALDTIADIVGTVLGLEMLQVEKLYVSKVDVGGGAVQCAHGILAVPVPAVVELLRGIPCYSKGLEVELVTPTGAALIAALAAAFAVRPEMVIDAVGYGAGSRELEIPNLLRIELGENINETGVEEQQAVMLEANIDDMQPELYGYLQKLLFQQGAQDVFFSSIYMKKNRPAVKLSVLAAVGQEKELVNTILQETTSIGLRSYRVTKHMLRRRVERLQTNLGEVKVKLGIMAGRIVNIAPEYDDCEKIAAERQIPLKQVYQEIMELARQKFKG